MEVKMKHLFAITTVLLLIGCSKPTVEAEQKTKVYIQGEWLCVDTKNQHWSFKTSDITAINQDYPHESILYFGYGFRTRIPATCQEVMAIIKESKQ